MLVKQPDIWRRFDLACVDFKTWKHFTDGSNSHIYKAKCAPSVLSLSHSTASHSGGEGARRALQPGLKVIIKALKDSELQTPIALKEFDSERELLASIRHANILQFLGSGVDLCDGLKKASGDSPQSSKPSSSERGVYRGNSMQSMLQGRAKIYPRPFLVLERLNGGSLALLLSQHQQKNTRLPPLRALQICQQLVLAVDYLHNHFHRDAVLIHRDIKPDNIGFDDQGAFLLSNVTILLYLLCSLLMV